MNVCLTVCLSSAILASAAAVALPWGPYVVPRSGPAMTNDALADDPAIFYAKPPPKTCCSYGLRVESLYDPALDMFVELPRCALDIPCCDGLDNTLDELDNGAKVPACMPKTYPSHSKRRPKKLSAKKRVPVSDQQLEVKDKSMGKAVEDLKELMDVLKSDLKHDSQ